MVRGREVHAHDRSGKKWSLVPEFGASFLRVESFGLGQNVDDWAKIGKPDGYRRHVQTGVDAPERTTIRQVAKRAKGETTPR